MGRYDPLGEFLRLRKEPVWGASFADVEQIVGFRLPASARKHPAWWANETEPKTHVHKHVLRDAGWRVDTCNLARETVVFRRDGASPNPRPSRPRRSAGGAAAGQPDPAVIPEWERATLVQCALYFEWTPVGCVRLDSEGELAFPGVAPLPGLYRFRVNSADGEKVYIGESGNVARRMGHCRNPGPGQRTDIRLNTLLRNALRDGAEIALAVVQNNAHVGRNWRTETADLSQKAVRLLLENAALMQALNEDVTLLNG